MKKKLIGVIGIVIVVIVGGIYYLTREEKIELSLKNKKEIIVEYGNTVQYSFDDLIQIKDLDKDKLKEIKKETPFYTYINTKEIYNTQNSENILVQGIIDLYYISKDGKLKLIDYKTDYVEKGEENKLIEKYKSQEESLFAI